MAEGGWHADLDHLDDTLSVQQFQVFDFEAMRTRPAEPLLFYVLHRVTAPDDPADRGRLKLW
jgi:hypothetical protein